MTHEQGRRASPERDGGLHVGLLADREHERAHETDHAWHLGDDDGEHHAAQAGARERDEPDGEQDGRNRHEAIHHAHHDAVESPHVAGHQADDEPDRRADDRHRHADEERDPGAIDDATVHIAPERVRAHPVAHGARPAVVTAHGALGTRPAIARDGIDDARIGGREHRRQHADGDHRGQDRAAKNHAAIAESHQYRMRGSSNVYERSTSRLMRT